MSDDLKSLQPFSINTFKVTVALPNPCDFAKPTLALLPALVKRYGRTLVA